MNTRREQRSMDLLQALVALQFSRLYRPLRMIVLTTAVLIAIDWAKRGLSADTVLPWMLGAFAMAPLIPCFTLLKERNDGSLRYVASLPVEGQLHGISRAITAFLLSVPSAAVAAYALHTQVAGLSPVVLVLFGLVVVLASTAISLALLAIQLGMEMGAGFARMLWIFPVFVGGGYVVGFARDRGWLVPLRTLVVSPAGLMTLSLALWAGLAVMGYVAVRSIGKQTVHYRGEPAKA